jgi:cytochrome c oxidase subunit 4
MVRTSDATRLHTEKQSHVAGIKTYVWIWFALILLTFITVGTASNNIAGIAIIVCLAIAAIKSSLVLLYFMHLRY